MPEVPLINEGFNGTGGVSMRGRKIECIGFADDMLYRIKYNRRN